MARTGSYKDSKDKDAKKPNPVVTAPPKKTKKKKEKSTAAVYYLPVKLQQKMKDEAKLLGVKTSHLVADIFEKYPKGKKK